MAARSHRADEHLWVEEVLREPDPVTEQSALRERARRIDRDHAGRALQRTDVPKQRGDQARLADARRSGDADRIRPSGRRVDVADDVCASGSPFSTREIARARARRSPERTPATSDSRVHSRRFATARLYSPATASSGSQRAGRRGRRSRLRRHRRPQGRIPRARRRLRQRPATTIPSPSIAYVVLMITVNTRPRSWSGAPRWTSSEL